MSTGDGQTRYALTPKAQLVTDRTRGQRVLLYPERGLVLNAAAETIIEACVRGTTLAALLDALQARFPEAERTKLEDDTLRFLTELKERGLVREHTRD